MMRYLIVTICLLLMVVPVAAQDNDGETIALSGAFNITVPDDWVEDDYSSSGYFWETADSSIRIRTYSPWSQTDFEAVGVDALMEFLVVDVFEARSLDTEAIETMQFGDYEGMSYTFEEIFQGERYLRMIDMYQIENGFIVVGYMSPLSGHDLNEDDVEALHATLATVTLQDTFVFYEGTSVPIPEGWQLIEDQNGFWAEVGMTNGSVEFRLDLWPSYGAIEGLEDHGDFMAYFADPYITDVEYFNPSRLVDAKIAGFDATLYPFTVETVNARGVYDRAVLAFSLPANNSAFTVRVATESLDESFDAIYEVLDALEPGEIVICALFANPGIRIRAEPSTSSEMVRQTEDENLIAVRQYTDDAGYIWFDVGEGWIRSDVIFHEYGACDDIPVKH